MPGDCVVRGGVEPPTFRFSVRLWASCGALAQPRTCGGIVGLAVARRIYVPGHKFVHTHSGREVPPSPSAGIGERADP